MVLKDPVKSDDYLVRRLAAVEGYEMVSTDEKDEPFVLEKDQCWVLADNENVKPKVYDPRNRLAFTSRIRYHATVFSQIFFCSNCEPCLMRFMLRFLNSLHIAIWYFILTVL